MPDTLTLRAPIGLRRRDSELLKLARRVEPDQPTLALDLRGIAMHEASAATPGAAIASDAWWRRAGRAVWHALEAHGTARARREILAYADRLECVRPDIARQLRSTTANG